MIEFAASFGFTPVQWVLVMFAAALIGANKTGMASISLIAIPILAAVFGGKSSTGVMLPLLIIADIIAVITYRKSIKWKSLLEIFPWAFAGIGIALWIGSFVPDAVFKILIAAAVIIVLVFMIKKELTGQNIKIENHWYVAAAIGLLGGFSTMIGNAAGPIISVYFLSLSLKKNEFISTTAWFFWLINLAKLPLQLFVWKTITPQSFGFDLLMLPAIAVGAIGGFLLIKRIPERPYRIFVIVATLVSSVFLII